MNKGYNTVLRMTQDEFDSGNGNSNLGMIEIIDESGQPTGKFLLCQRMTQAQRLALTPAEGLEVFQTDNGAGKYQYAGGAWHKLSNLAIAHFNAYDEATPLISGFGPSLVTFPLNAEHQTTLNNMTFSDAGDTLTVISEGLYEITFVEHGTSGSSVNWGHVSQILKNGVAISKGTGANGPELRISVSTEYVGRLSVGDVISFKVEGINAPSNIVGGQITVKQIS